MQPLGRIHTINLSNGLYNEPINQGDRDMIKSGRELAIALSKGEVQFSIVSKALHEKVALWARRKEITITGGVLRMAS
jgi:hypothetical protein